MWSQVEELFLPKLPIFLREKNQGNFMNFVKIVIFEKFLYYWAHSTLSLLRKFSIENEIELLGTQYLVVTQKIFNRKIASVLIIVQQNICYLWLLSFTRSYLIRMCALKPFSKIGPCFCLCALYHSQPNPICW